MEKRLRSSLQTSAEEFLSSAAKLPFKSSKSAIKTLINTSVKPASDLTSSLPLALCNSISHSISRYKNLHGSTFAGSPVTPPQSAHEDLRVTRKKMGYLPLNTVKMEDSPLSGSSRFMRIFCAYAFSILKKKVDVHRVYTLREAFMLFDFEDESIEDLKHLLIRCVISPLYLKTEEGRKFIAFMFGFSVQLMKEVCAMIKSQIPFGRKSMLEAYGEIIFRAWKAAEGECKYEIENGFLQGLIEGAIYASSAALAASIRRILGGLLVTGLQREQRNSFSVLQSR
ncbi:UNVERIFIED_CONTAM: Condensin-2 complex subunit G2 [Sesamum angustifolium]|uniref:Condensin-2 complex subunit G2 n=1 Tax=Sesamum angustifolium TaxID=2727405 RepID=A0AAW2NIT4_9LAMI